MGGSGGVRCAKRKQKNVARERVPVYCISRPLKHENNNVFCNIKKNKKDGDSVEGNVMIKTHLFLPCIFVFIIISVRTVPNITQEPRLILNSG